jgi:hypothetical protein
MYRNEYICKVGFTKVMDRTCGQCGGIYSSSEKSNCPKCNAPLIVPTIKTEKGPRPYCFTEVTLYPVMSQDIRQRYAAHREKAKGLPWIIRMKLWGKYDEKNNIVVPDRRTPWLTQKKEVRVLFQTPPIYTLFESKEHGTSLQILYTVKRGDDVQFLGPKEYSANAMEQHENLTAEVKSQEVAKIDTPPANNDMEEMKATLMQLTKRFLEMESKPAPAEVAQVNNQISDAPDPSEGYASEDLDTYEVERYTEYELY